jgi:SAM-dependent methyltransferase
MAKEALVTTTATVARYERRQRNRVMAWAHGRRFQRTRTWLQSSCRRNLNVVEIGCGTGRLFGALQGLDVHSYLGIDTDAASISEATRKHGGDVAFRALAGDAADLMPDLRDVHAVIALETLEHMPLADAERIVKRVAAAGSSRPELGGPVHEGPVLICTVPVEVGPVVLAKQVARRALGYNHEYSWTDALWAALDRLDKLEAHTVWHVGFDWRRLADVLRAHFRVVTVESLPHRDLPLGLATNVFMVARP